MREQLRRHAGIHVRAMTTTTFYVRVRSSASATTHAMAR
jgi:hypothetical protein